ncbi:MAG: ATP-binding protein, partial [Elusimicrobia bacterium]|nr:ATP-binding protein [Elusimicrobiota bacterium]
AVAGLAFVGRERRPDSGAVLVFSTAKNDSRLRPGTRGRLSCGDPRRPAAFVELLEDSFDGRDYQLKLLVVSQNADAVFDGSETWVLDEDVFDLLDVELGMLREAERAGLEEWIEGREPARLAEPEAGLAGSPFASGAEGSLAFIFEEVSRARNWHAVQGPPGTGKTQLLARLALDAAARQGLRVLVTAVSHQAIHNALAQCYWLAAETDDPAARELCRAGFFKLGSSKALLTGLPAGVRAARRLPKRRALIAGGTLYSLFGAGEEPPHFDLVLFDEAGQARLPLALGARVAGTKAVFIGDDSQLPPVAQAAPRGAPAAKSVLALVREKYGAPLFLTETRRMNDQLCAAVSECFYEGRVAPTAEAAGRRLPLSRVARPEFAPMLDPEASLVFVDVPHAGARGVSEPEARWAAALAAEAIHCGVAGREIGVVSPFRAQCNRIRFLLQGSGRAAGAQAEEVLVSTVERFQGQEREMVVLSLAASEPSYLA